ncbi:MAG: thrombospondin type 3 repeat-containing protein [Byssovorax sp.]
MIGAIGLGSGAALGDPKSAASGVRVDQLQPASPDSPFVRAEGPHEPLPDGAELAASLGVEYARGLLREVAVDTAGNKSTLATLVDSALLARIGASVMPFHWLAADVSVPFALMESGDAPVPYGRGALPPAAKAPGVGDPRIGLHLRPVDGRAFGLILGGRIWAPVGSQDAYLSDARFRGEVDIGVAGQVKSILYGCTVSVSPGVFLKRDGDRLGAACAVHIAPVSFLSVGVEPSFAMFNIVDAKDNAAFALQIEPLAAVRLRFGSFNAGVAGGPGFGDAPGAASMRVLAQFGYAGASTPPKPPPAGPRDRDLDGIIDAQDACPAEAGPASRDPKQNGCPGRDRDGDGIRDEEDYCPDRAGIPYPDPKATGCPDTDNDGLPDPIDPCKSEPGPEPSGCPRYARLGTAGFTVTPPIEFTKDDKLTDASRQAIEEIASTMRANPKLDQVSFGVGTKGANAKTADKRAQEILMILRAGHLDASRYEVLLRDDVPSGAVIVRNIR